MCRSTWEVKELLPSCADQKSCVSSESPWSSLLHQLPHLAFCVSSTFSPARDYIPVESKIQWVSYTCWIFALYQCMNGSLISLEPHLLCQSAHTTQCDSLTWDHNSYLKNCQCNQRCPLGSFRCCLMQDFWPLLQVHHLTAQKARMRL